MVVDLKISFTGDVPKEHQDLVREGFDAKREAVEQEYAEIIKRVFFRGLDNIEGTVTLSIKDDMESR